LEVIVCHDVQCIIVYKSKISSLQVTRVKFYAGHKIFCGT